MTYKTIATLLSIGIASTVHGQLLYDEDVIPDVIFGSGNANGGFTVDRSNGIELGLRAKLRFNDSGVAENTFNSQGDGTYVFATGAAPGSTDRPIWNFEWSINSDWEGTSGNNLNDFIYLLSIDNNPDSGFLGETFTTFDPINQPFADHAIGNNATVGNTGVEAANSTEYASLIDNNNVAQNSWAPNWFTPTFDPTAQGEYTILLEAYSQDGSLLAQTNITVAAVPEPSTWAALSLGVVGSLLFLRRRRRTQSAR